MNFEHNIWRTFDRACRKIAQMVMATDLPREDPIGSERTRSEFRTNATESSTNPSANSMDCRHSPNKNNTCRTKNTVSSGSSESEAKEKNDLSLINGPLSSSGVLTAGQDGCNPNSQVLQLRQLLLLHLELIQQQQEQLQHKDKELNQLKIDKEQLEARIHRMERRMAMKKRHGTDEEDEIYSTEPVGGKGKAAKVPSKRRLSTEQLIRSKRVPIQAPVVMSSSMCDDPISYDTHLRTETLYLSHQACISPSAKIPEFTLPITPNTEAQKEKNEVFPIAVPSWAVEDLAGSTSSTSYLQSSNNSTKSIATSSISEDIEDLDDETFGKRHAKYELDEKRRKRWDIQRMRSLSYHETLEKKHLEREQARLKGRKAGKELKDDTQEPMLTFQPKAEGIMALEVSDTVPVVAFGSPIPLFHSKEFDLPWFSLEKRVLQERGKATRGGGRGRARSRRRANHR